MNLTGLRDPESILERHFVECIALARALPSEITTVLDYGSGAGFPGVPIALCRPEILVTLAESQNKKAAFLRELIRSLGITAQVHSGRAESLSVKFDCVTLRAVDHMAQAVQVAGKLVGPGGWLAPMTTVAAYSEVVAAAGSSFEWDESIALYGSDRVMAFGRRRIVQLT